jgi:hypothetical protein
VVLEALAVMVLRVDLIVVVVAARVDILVLAVEAATKLHLPAEQMEVAVLVLAEIRILAAVA